MDAAAALDRRPADYDERRRPGGWNFDWRRCAGGRSCRRIRRCLPGHPAGSRLRGMGQPGLGHPQPAADPAARRRPYPGLGSRSRGRPQRTHRRTDLFHHPYCGHRSVGIVLRPVVDCDPRRRPDVSPMSRGCARRWRRSYLLRFAEANCITMSATAATGWLINLCTRSSTASRPRRSTSRRTRAYLFFSRRHRQAFEHILFGISERKGFIQITGEVGAGKSTICRKVLEELREGYATALILNPVMTPIQLMRSILRELHLDDSRQRPGSTGRAAQRVLARSRPRRSGGRPLPR